MELYFPEPEKSIIKICTQCQQGYSYKTDLFSNPYVCQKCDIKFDNKCENNQSYKEVDDCQCIIL